MEPENFAYLIITSMVLLGLIAFLTISIIPAGHVGVYDLFGKVRTNEYNSGFYVINPFARMKKISIMTQEYTMTIVEGEGAVNAPDTISALTKEGLTVDLDITILYKLDKTKVDEIYTTVGLEYVDILVRPKARESIRNIIAKYDAKKIYSEDREKIQQEIQEAIEIGINERGIIVENVLLRNVKLPEKVKTAIENKLEAEQQSQEMVFILEKEQQEAERKRLEAAGIADANAIISGSLTDEYLSWYWISNLDKHEDTIYVPIGSDGMPLFRSV